MSSKQKIRTNSKSPESKNEIKKSKNNHNDSNNSGPVRPYLESTITSIVQKGLIELDKERPDNPLEFLGNYLLMHSKEN